MRSLLVIVTCAFTVGAVVFVVINAPTPGQKDQIVVNRIDIEDEAQPVLKSNPAAKHILDHFPELTQPEPLHETPAQPQPAAEPKTTQAEPQGTGSMETDKRRLLAMIDDWVYVNFTQFGQIKRGQIKAAREGMVFDVNEGQKLDNGIVVQSLSEERASLRYGEALFHLQLAQEPDFFADIRENPRPLTPEEQKEAYNYYMKRYGEKFKAFSENYQPPPGVPKPKRVTDEEYQKGLKAYHERYGQRFQQEAQQYNQTYPMPKEQLENYKKYWQRFHPDKEMPDFESLTEIQQVGPGNRIQSSENE